MNDVRQNNLIAGGCCNWAWPSGISLAGALPGEFWWGAAQAAAPAGILVGTARVDMTPTLPSPFDIGVLEVADTVCQRLFARMVYLESGDQRMLLVSTDTAGILHTAYRTFREAIARKTGLTPGQIVHQLQPYPQGSLLQRGRPGVAGEDALSAGWNGELSGLDSAPGGGGQACGGEQAAGGAVGGAGASAGAGLDRRLLYLSEYHERRFNKRRKFPIGTTDPTLGVVKAQTADGKALAILCFYACHPTVAEPGLRATTPALPWGSWSGSSVPRAPHCSFRGCAGNVRTQPPLAGSG